MNQLADTPANIANLLKGGRWAMLHHTMPASSSRKDHFDLLIEVENTLLTWACDDNIFVQGNASAQQLAEHRKAYLTYEGPISNDRGEVQRLASGNYHNAECREENAFSIHVAGGFTGELRFERTEPTLWNLFFRAIDRTTTSVR